GVANRFSSGLIPMFMELRTLRSISRASPQVPRRRYDDRHGDGTSDHDGDDDDCVFQTAEESSGLLCWDRAALGCGEPCAPDSCAGSGSDLRERADWGEAVCVAVVDWRRRTRHDGGHGGVDAGDLSLLATGWANRHWVSGCSADRPI